MSTAPNSRIQRHTASSPCRVCGGWDGMRRGNGERCHGYLSTDGKYEHCSREDLAGDLPVEKEGTFAHRLQGDCKCGRVHGPALATFPPPRKGGGKKAGKAARRPSGPGIEKGRWGYLEGDGAFLFEVRRKDFPDGSKTYSQWSLGEGGELVPGRNGTPEVLYRLPDLAKDDPEEALYVVEGEKCVDDLRARGLSATCNPGGAGKWRPEFAERLRDRHVFILRDNDPVNETTGARVGWAHAEDVARSLEGVAASIKVVDLADGFAALKLGVFPEKGDSFDFFQLGGTVEHLEWVADRAPEWAGGDAEEEWDDPILVRAGTAMPFPAHVFPVSLADLIRIGSKSFPCPPDLLAIPALAIASVAIGRSVVLKVRARGKRVWCETASLYLALVAATGQTKTPAINLMEEPLKEIGRELRIQAKKEEAAYKVELAMRSAMKGAGDSPPPDEPFPRRIKLDYSTVEAMVEMLAYNPRGMIQFKDELKGLFAGMDQYKGGGKGDDRQYYLSFYSGKETEVDRKSQRGKSIIVYDPFLTVFGGIQPEILADLNGINEPDGLFERFLFSLPDGVPIRWPEVDVPDDLCDSWNAAIHRLWGRDLIKGTDAQGREYLRPFYVGMTDDAAALFKAFYNALGKEEESEDFPQQLRGAWPKFRASCARLALLLEQLHWAYDPTSGDTPPPVGKRAMEGAIELIGYFQAHLRRVRNVERIPVSQAARDGRAILTWAEGASLKEFSEREIRKTLPARFPQEGTELADALAWLQGRHCIRPVEVKAAPRGRKPTPRYRLSPELSRESAGKTGKKEIRAKGDSVSQVV